VKVVLDTNVFVSGVFFGGPPHKILEAWRDGKVRLLLSPAIPEEYQRVMRDLAVQFPDVGVEALIAAQEGRFSGPFQLRIAE
jgi:predicted nucleic acid-binding protein